jgi:hypothetical protein
MRSTFSLRTLLVAVLFAQIAFVNFKWLSDWQRERKQRQFRELVDLVVGTIQPSVWKDSVVYPTQPECPDSLPGTSRSRLACE